MSFRKPVRMSLLTTFSGPTNHNTKWTREAISVRGLYNFGSKIITRYGLTNTDCGLKLGAEDHRHSDTILGP